MPKAACYVRVSTEGQASDDKSSVSNQKAQCLAMAEREGYKDAQITWYEDTSAEPFTSYTPRLHKPKIEMRDPSRNVVTRKYADLCAEIAKGTYGHVFALDTTRLCGGFARMEELRKAMEAANDTGHAVVIQLAAQGQLSMSMMGIMAAVSFDEMETRKRRLRAGRKGSLVLGKPPTGHVPYGYVRVKGKTNEIVVNEPAAKVLRRVAGLYMKGLTTRAIADRLSSERVPLPRGADARWIGSTVGHLITAIRMGWYSGTPKEVSIRRGAVDGYTGQYAWPKIIAEDVMEGVRRAHDGSGRSKRYSHEARWARPWYLQGLVYDHCSENPFMCHSVKRDTTYSSYRCQADLIKDQGGTRKPDCPVGINAEELEQAVWGALCDFLQNEQAVADKLRERIAEIMAGADVARRKVEDIQAQLNRVVAADKRLADAIADGTLTREVARDRLQANEKERQRLSSDLHDAERTRQVAEGDVALGEIKIAAVRDFLLQKGALSVDLSEVKYTSEGWRAERLFVASAMMGDDDFLKAEEVPGSGSFLGPRRVKPEWVIRTLGLPADLTDADELRRVQAARKRDLIVTYVKRVDVWLTGEYRQWRKPWAGQVTWKVQLPAGNVGSRTWSKPSRSGSTKSGTAWCSISPNMRRCGARLARRPSSF